MKHLQGRIEEFAEGVGGWGQSPGAGKYPIDERRRHEVVLGGPGACCSRKSFGKKKPFCVFWKPKSPSEHHSFMRCQEAISYQTKVGSAVTYCTL